MGEPTEVRPGQGTGAGKSQSGGASSTSLADSADTATPETCSASPTKPKSRRRSPAKMAEFRAALYEIVAANQPCTVRQVYYRGLGRLWEKDTGGDRTNYNDVCRNLGVMRERDELPWGWLVDSTRFVRQDTMYESILDAQERTYEQYRRNLWAAQPVRVEVWAESDSTSSMIDAAVRPLGVGLYSCRGQAGKEFVQASAATYRRIGKPVKILYVGDWDPSGLAIQRSLEERLTRYSKGAVDITFTRIAVTPDQITGHGLERHDVNPKDRNLARFVEECRLVGLAEDDAVEAEAFAPATLRQIVSDAIYEAIPDATAWNREIDLEQIDRAQLREAIDAGWWSA